MKVYNLFCKNIILPISDLFLGLKVRVEFNIADKLQFESRENIEQYQLERFKELIKQIYTTVPFYKRYFNKHNLTPNDFVSLGDIKKLPVITKKTLHDNFNDLQVEGFAKKIYEMKSSGSTGVSSTVLIDRAIQSEVFATQLLFWSWGSFYMGTPHIQTGMSLNRGLIKAIKDYIFRCEYVSAFGLTDEKINVIISKINQKRIKYLFGYASSIYVIAKHLSNNNIHLPLERIFTWGDCLFPHYRELIEKYFECTVHDCYGLGEGLQVAAQCDKGGALHVAEHKVYIEILKSSRDDNGTDESLGKILITRFETGPMPLIRYDSGDLASFVAGECECGRKLKMISRIHGRDTDVIQSPAGDRLIVHYFTRIFEMIPEIKQFQIRQCIKEEINILYVPASNFSDSVLERIRKEIHSECVYKFKVNFNLVKNIPLQKSNKRRFVVSSIPFI